MFKELFTESGVTYKGGTCCTNEIKSLLSNYDFYVSYIEDYQQLKKAKEKNDNIKSELKKRGVTEISNGDITIKIG